MKIKLKKQSCQKKVLYVRIAQVNKIQDFIMKMVQEMKILSLLNKYFKEQFFVFIGFCIIIYMCYVRLICTRLPKILNSDVNWITTVIFIIIFIIMLFLFLINLKKFLIINNYYVPRQTSNIKLLRQLFLDLLLKLSNIMSNSLLAVHALIINNINKEYIYRVSLFIVKVTNINRIYIFKIMFDLIPKSICLVIFIYEVLLYNKIDLIYQLSPLLLLPMLFNYFLFVIKEDSLNGIFEFDDYILITNQQGIHISSIDYFRLRAYNFARNLDFDLTKYRYSFTDNYFSANKDMNVDWPTTLQVFMVKFNDYILIQCYALHLETLDALYHLQFKVLFYFIYSLIWGYVLFLII